MYVLMARHTDDIQRKLAEHKSRLLILACGEIAKTWPAGRWILRLFEAIFKNMDDKTGGQPGNNQHRQANTRLWPFTDDTHVAEQASDPCLPDPQSDHVLQEPSADFPVYGAINENDGLMSNFLPELGPQFSNITDMFDMELLNGMSQGFGTSQNLFLDLMES
jgi:hypothetical protein